MKIKSTRWSALIQVFYDNHWTLIEIKHVTKTDARIRHYDSLNRKADGREILKCVENWLKLISSVTKVIKSPMLQLPQQAVSSNDCGVFVCAYIEYASLIISWDELNHFCKPERSLKNRLAIRNRIEFFRVNQEPTIKWNNSCFKMEERE